MTERGTETGRPAPWLVGGPGRSGKTTLVHALNAGEGPVAGFPVEGLFTFYLKRRFLFFPVHRYSLLAEYLDRPRYMDSARDETWRPVEFFRDPLPDILADIPSHLHHQIRLFDWALQRFAEDNGRETWATFDLHPEFRFPTFKRHIRRLKLAFMVRDPRESLSDMMYWRHYPEGTPRPHRRFKHSLVMWCLGIQTARWLAARYPGDVELFSFDALLRGDPGECARLAAAFRMEAKDVRAAFDFTPRLDAPGVLAGGATSLLDEAERAEIAILGAPVAGEFVRFFATDRGDPRAARRGFVRAARLILALGRASPRLARLATDFAYFPRNSVKRMANSLLRMIKDNAHGIRQLAAGRG